MTATLDWRKTDRDEARHLVCAPRPPDEKPVMKMQVEEFTDEIIFLLNRVFKIDATRPISGTIFVLSCIKNSIT